MRIHWRVILVILGLGGLLALTQNCTDGFRANRAGSNGASQATPNPPNSPPGPNPEPGPGPVPPPPASTEVPTLVRTDFMTGLKNPWDLAFLPDGTMFLTERCYGLSVRLANGTVHRLFGASGFSLVASDLFCEGQSGAQGVALDPDFATNRFVYVYLSSKAGSNPASNHIVRLTVASDFTAASNRTDIVTDIAYKNVANAWGGAGSHSGGRIRFGPDKLLYITTGDNHNGTLPQDGTRMGGKVLRVDREGRAAPGNSSPFGSDTRLYTYGHRNVQGITFRPGTWQPFISEHGPGHTDEVTPLVAGGNGGWDPKPEAGVSCDDNYCGYSSNKVSGELTPMTDLGKFPTAMKPIWTNGGKSEGLGPCTFLTGTQWKAWENRLLVGVMRVTRFDLLKLNDDASVAETETLTLPAQRPRSLVQGPDGSLYVATDSGNIWRVTPQ